MSEPKHHDVVQDKIETHFFRFAIGVGIGAVALVIGIILVVQFAIGRYGSRSLTDDPAMAPEAVAKRIAPVAKLVADPSAALSPVGGAKPAPGAASAAIAPLAPKAAPASGNAGKATYEGSCVACHGAGVAGAPKFADKAAWGARVKAGTESLYASVLKGKGAMPPKGGNATLADADVKAAVDYMIAAAK